MSVRVVLLACAVPALAGLTAGAQEKEKEPAKTSDSEPARKTRVRLGNIIVGAGYSRYSGPGWHYYPGYWSPYYWGAWSPYWWPYYYDWYAPGFHPGYWNGFSRGPNLGEVRLRAQPAAGVYIDGAYAGVAKDLKSMWLEPGAYDLEVRDDGAARFKKRIYVLSGKSLRLDATPESNPPEAQP